jgi:hypothetical protein
MHKSKERILFAEAVKLESVKAGGHLTVKNEARITNFESF